MTSRFAALVAQRLRRRAEPGVIYEQYGPDGEILVVWEGRPNTDGSDPLLIEMTWPGGREPRSDWRNRGVVPPGGIRSLSSWREVGWIPAEAKQTIPPDEWERVYGKG